MPEVKSLSVNCLYPHPDNPRKDLGDLTELTANIKANGIFQNLMVVPAKEVGAVWDKLVRLDPPPDDAHVVVIGHRRFAAAKQAGLTEVPCTVVSLSPAEQIATMLEENMHRADLNVYEKTRGFQMMLDLGETVESIVKKRGFSESTVRRHLKFAAFDDKTFQDVAEKQITLDTLSEVAKIESPKKRNEVLASYGSNNFQWNLTNAVTQQEAKKNRPAAKAEILAYATEVKNIDYGRCEHVMTVQFAKYKPGCATPKDGTKGDFIVSFTDQYAAIYRKKRKSPTKKKSQAELEREAELRRRETELAELTETAYSLRLEFAKSLSVSVADYPKLMKHACYALIACQVRYCGGSFADKFPAFLGMGSLNHLTPVDVCRTLMDEVEKATPCVKHLIAAIYVAYGDHKTVGYWQKSYSGEFPKHSPNAILDYLYAFLCDFGYEMSDAERELKDGTHPLLDMKSGDAS